MSIETMSKQQLNARLGMNLVTSTVLVPVWDGTAESHSLSNAGEYTCGSDDRCDIVVAMKGVADSHCSVFNHNGITTVVPKFGQPVWVNEVAISNPERLQSGDSLAIGPATFRIEVRHEMMDTAPAKSRVDHVEDTSSTQGLVDQIQRLEARVAEAESTATNAVKSPSAAFEAKFLSQLPQVPVVASRREHDLNAREDELNRRSEMLQQQLAMFKTRHHQLQQNETQAEARIQESQAAFEAEIQRRQAELKEEAERLDAAKQHQEQQIGQQNEALQRKQQDLEQVAADLKQDREQHKRQQAERDELRQKEQSDLQAQRAQVAAELDKLNQSIAEIAQHHHDAQSGAERLRTRELELAGFQEELRHRHEDVESSAEKIRLQKAEVESVHAAADAQSKEIAAARKTNEKLSEELKQKAAEIDQMAESLRAEKEALVANQKQDADATEQLRSSLEAQSKQLIQETKAQEEREAELLHTQEKLNRLQDDVLQRDQAFTAQQDELAETQQKLAAKQDQFHQLQKEVEKLNQSAKTEVEQQLADLREKLSEREQEIAELQDLVERQPGLDARDAEFADREQQIQEQVNAVQQQADRLATMAAELEKQKKALEQQDLEQTERLATLSAELDARRVSFSEAEDCQSLEANGSSEQQDALDARQTELEAWAVELDARHNETASRVQAFKKLAAVDSDRSLDQTPSVAQSFQAQQDLESARRHAEQLGTERDKLAAERDQLSTALIELKAAFESARDEIAAYSMADDQDSASSELLSERTAELEAANLRLQEADEERQKLTGHIEELVNRLDVHEQQTKQRIAEAVAEGTAAGDSETEQQLLQQVEELKSEIASKSDGNNPAAGLHSQIAEYEQTIEELKSNLQQANQQCEEGSNAADESVYLETIAELKLQLEKQQQLIDSHNAGLDSDTGGGKVEEAERLHRELDERTSVLDNREGEIRERARMVEQSASEIEEQQRQLVEARQQLELARAEIHLANESATPSVPVASMQLEAPPVPSQPVVSFDRVDDEGGEKDVDESHADDAEALAVRSEIAELFGIGEAKSEPPAALHSELPAVDDYSQEKAAAVAMSFQQSNSVLLDAPIKPEREASQEDGGGDESGGDDFVASYMEQLLARNRGNAGGSLPAELTTESQAKKTPTKEKAADPPKETPKPVGQKSFIDAYMSGEFEDGDGSSPMAQANADQDGPSQEPAAPRAKIDLAALRNDMVSFRELSTKSVESALATHAKRQVQGGITARTTIFLALVVVTLFLIFAALMEVIPFGVVCWLAIVATAASGIELGIRTSQLKKKINDSMLGGDPRTAEQMAADAAMLRKVDPTQQQATMYGPEANSHQEPAKSNDIVPPIAELNSDDADDDDAEYFEL